MKFISKIFVNTGLFSVLAMLLLVPMLAVTFMNFSAKSVEKTEVLSAQDSKETPEKELNNDVPKDLEVLIKQMEQEMAEQAAKSAANNSLEIGQ